MSENGPSGGGNDKESASKSGELLANEIHFASSVVTPFAAAVAVELEEFGLSKQKIDEIMLRSAKRFGAMNDAEPRGPSAQEADNKSENLFDRLKSAPGEAFDFTWSLIEKHGPRLVDRVGPIAMEVLEQAISEFLKDAMRSSGGAKSKSKPRR